VEVDSLADTAEVSVAVVALVAELVAVVWEDIVEDTPDVPLAV
jgi:hypothetical protein